MCWQCDHPDKTYDDYLDLCRVMIQEHGWMIQFVEGNRRRAPCAYTAGLTAHGLPELVVTGLCTHQAHDLLQGVAESAVGEEPWQSATVVVGAGKLIWEIVAVAVPDAHLSVANDLYGPGVTALQFVHMDARGHSPWHPGYRRGRYPQPVLGPRTTPLRCVELVTDPP